MKKKIKASGFLDLLDDIERTMKDNISKHKLHLSHLQRLRMEWKRKAAQEKNTAAQLRAKGIMRDN